MTPTLRVTKGDNLNAYFVTIVTVEWIDIFTKPEYFQTLADSLKFCIKKKGLILYEYVFMTNHIHLICSGSGKGPLLVLDGAIELAKKGVEIDAIEPAKNINKSKSAGSAILSGASSGLDDIIRDFKSYTTHEVKKLLKHDNRKYISRLIKNSYGRHKDNDFQIWQRENYPELLISDHFRDIKINYIWQNPVRKGYVYLPEDWAYSSARQKILGLASNHPDLILPCAEWT